MFFAVIENYFEKSRMTKPKNLEYHTKWSLTGNFSLSFKFKICQKFKTSQRKITKYKAVKYFWLADFNFYQILNLNW
jgi:hypothetical protein